jgi:integrase
VVEREAQAIPWDSNNSNQEAQNDYISSNNTKIGCSQKFITKTQVFSELGRTEKVSQGIQKENAVIAFEARRKNPNQSKTIDSFLEDCKKISNRHSSDFRAMTLELDIIVLRENGITLPQFLDSMSGLVSNNEDITEDIKTLRQLYYDYLGEVGRDCAVCNDDGKTINDRLTRMQHAKGNMVTMYSKCITCDGTKKKLKACAYGTRDKYVGRFDKMFRYFGLYNKIDFTNLKIVKPKKLKFKPKPLRYDTLKEMINVTTLIPRKIHWQFLAQSGARIAESCKTRKSDCIFVDENGKELRNEKGMDRIKVIIRAEQGNKTRVERETFVHIEIQDYVLKRLRSINDSDYVFHDSTKLESAESNEFEAFKTVRKKMIENGFKEMDERKPTSNQHRITVHTLRSFFISKANRMDDSSFGDAIAGHTDLMRGLYDRIDEKELLELWKKSEKRTSLNSDNSSEEFENTIKTLRTEIANIQEENQTKIDEALKIEKANMQIQFESQSKELYNKIFELMDKLEQKSN